MSFKFLCDPSSKLLHFYAAGWGTGRVCGQWRGYSWAFQNFCPPQRSQAHDGFWLVQLTRAYIICQPLKDPVFRKGIPLISIRFCSVFSRKTIGLQPPEIKNPSLSHCIRSAENLAPVLIVVFTRSIRTAQNSAKAGRYTCKFNSTYSPKLHF